MTFPRWQKLERRFRVWAGWPLRDETAAVVLGITPAASGEDVKESTALNFSAVYAAVNLLSRSVATLPLYAYRRSGEDRQRAPAHPVSRLLHSEPNPEMTAFGFRQTMQAHVLLWGNAFATIERDSDGRPAALWPINPAFVRVSRDKGGLVYEVLDESGTPQRYQSPDVLHLRALSTDGLLGLGPVRLARESIGLAIAAEKFAARFYANSARPSGALKYPKPLRPEQVKRIRESWEAIHGGAGAHRTAILEDGLDWISFTMPLEEAQFLQTRQFSVTEIARWFAVPPHLIGDLQRATFSNIEHQGLEYVIYSLMPWLVNWEQELGRKLLSAAEREVYFVEHSVDGLLRGDVQSRYAAYQIALSNGFMSIDEVRRLENLNPLPDGRGADFVRPLNLAPVGEEPVAPEPPEPPADDNPPADEADPQEDETPND